MEILHPKNLSPPAFKGYKTAPLKEGETVVKYLLKKKEYPKIDTLSFLTALTSMTGFAIGGAGLLGDYFYDLKTGKNKTDKGNNLKAEIIENKNASAVFKDFGTSSGKKVIYISQKSKEEGAKTIIPSTKMSKIGLMFAKVGIAFSGIAGIFNGISMGLPLMAAGETLNLAASPIIETPLGTGLFGIALAAVFSGRALEHDPLLKLDMSKLAQKTNVKEKSLYVLDNVKNCAKEVLNTAGLFGKNIKNLFVKTEKAGAINFFKNNVFTIKPKNLVIQEFTNESGNIKKVVTTFKNNPYLMHAASLVLAIGGGILAISSIIKNQTGQKVGLKTYELGGSFDNLSLSRSGWEKAAMASSPSGKLAGNLLGLSGLTILAGQPGVDTKWGRGTQWLGTALLFAVFAVERKGKAFKSIAAKEELTSLVRQWSVDLTKLHPGSALKEKIPGSIFKTRLDSIINAVKDDEPIKKAGPIKKLFTGLIKTKQPKIVNKKVEDNTLKAILDFTEEKIKGKAYQAENFDFVNEFEKYAKEKNISVSMENVKAAVKKEGRDGNIEELKTFLKKEAEDTFQQI